MFIRERFNAQLYIWQWRRRVLWTRLKPALQRAAICSWRGHHWQPSPLKINWRICARCDAGQHFVGLIVWSVIFSKMRRKSAARR